ncbi:MAG TPA: hypothetical protein VD905_07275 [Flavobacteriales bacterium]|nr:hypothetical protein [Flavobacteriales bacterium]
MKKIILFACVTLLTENVFSQDWNGYSDPALDKEVWDVFKKSKLYVVLENKGDSTYEKSFMNEFKKRWSFNEVEFIGIAKKDSLMSQSGHFFLMLNTIDRRPDSYLANAFNQEKWFSIYQFNPGQKDQSWKSLAHVTYYAHSAEPETYMPMFINYLQWYCNLAAQEKIKGKRAFGQFIGVDFPDTKEQVHTKPLYILDIYLNKFIENLADVKKWYSADVYVVTENELKNILKTNDDINIYSCELESTMARTSVEKNGDFVNKTYSYVGVSYSFVHHAKTGELLYKKYIQLNAANAPGVLKFMLKEWDK